MVGRPIEELRARAGDRSPTCQVVNLFDDRVVVDDYRLDTRARAPNDTGTREREPILDKITCKCVFSAAANPYGQK